MADQEFENFDLQIRPKEHISNFLPSQNPNKIQQCHHSSQQPLPLFLWGLTWQKVAPNLHESMLRPSSNMGWRMCFITLKKQFQGETPPKKTILPLKNWNIMKKNTLLASHLTRWGECACWDLHAPQLLAKTTVLGLTATFCHKNGCFLCSF